MNSKGDNQWSVTMIVIMIAIRMMRITLTLRMRKITKMKWWQRYDSNSDSDDDSSNDDINNDKDNSRKLEYVLSKYLNSILPIKQY